MIKIVYLFCLSSLLPALSLAAPPQDQWLEKVTKGVEGMKLEKPEKARKLLVYSVTRGYRHGSIPTGKIAMRLLGEKTGAFEAVISDDLANFEPGNIDQFDAICFLNTTQDVFKPDKGVWKKMDASQRQEARKKELRLQKSFIEFLKSGKGFDRYLLLME